MITPFYSFFPAGLKSLVPIMLPTWILLNQDRKLLNAWEECSNHLGSVSYRLQYLAELLCLPASHSRVPAAPAGRAGRGCSALLCLCLLLCALWVISPSYLMKSFTSALMIVFNQRDQNYFSQLSVWFISGSQLLGLTETMKITIQITKFRHSKPDCPG